MKEKQCRQIWFPLWAMEIRLFRGLSECPANRNIIFRLYRFSFHKPIKSRLVRDAYICPSNSRTALQNLRVTLWNSGYGMSVYLVVAKFKVFNSLQFKKLCLFDRYDTRWYNTTITSRYSSFHFGLEWDGQIGGILSHIWMATFSLL